MSNQEKMEQAARRFARQIASVLCQAMSDADMSPDQVDAVLQAGKGYTQDVITSLIQGRAGMTLRTLAEISHALGHMPQLMLYQLSNWKEKPDEEEDGGGNQSTVEPPAA